MKFKEYVENLKKILEEHPETADMDVVYSRDDEGNGFNRVHYTPTVGYYDQSDGDFSETEEEDGDANAICIN